MCVNRKTETDLLIKELSAQVGQNGFLGEISTRYKKIMSFQHCHFIHLNQAGEFFFEEINGPYDIETFLTYQHEDVWRPENRDTPINSILNQRIDETACLKYAESTNLYNWLLNNQKCRDALGTIHPCMSAFVCFRLGEKPLDDEAYLFHTLSVTQIMNLYYLDRKIKRGNLIGDLFKSERLRMKNAPLMILNSDFQVIYDEDKFCAELNKCGRKLHSVISRIRIVLSTSKPKIRGEEESYEFSISNKKDSINILIQPLYKSETILYLCYLRILKPDYHFFTKRESEIIGLIDQGLSNKAIAARLYISAETVKKHIYNMMSGTDAENRISLVNLYKKNGNYSI